MGWFSDVRFLLVETGRCPQVGEVVLVVELEEKLLWVCEQVTEHTPDLRIDIL